MMIEKALEILDAPDHIKNAILKEYKITSKRAKQEALSALRQVEEGILEWLKINGQEWSRMNSDDQRYMESSKDFVEHAQRANATLETMGKRSLTRRETLTLAVDMEHVGFDKAAILVFDTPNEQRQKIMDRAEAIGTLKQKIDHVRGYHGIDKDGNLIVW